MEAPGSTSMDRVRAAVIYCARQQQLTIERIVREGHSLRENQARPSREPDAPGASSCSAFLEECCGGSCLTQEVVHQELQVLQQDATGGATGATGATDAHLPNDQHCGQRIRRRLWWYLFDFLLFPSSIVVSGFRRSCWCARRVVRAGGRAGGAQIGVVPEPETIGGPRQQAEVQERSEVHVVGGPRAVVVEVEAPILLPAGICVNMVGLSRLRSFLQGARLPEEDTRATTLIARRAPSPGRGRGGAPRQSVFFGRWRYIGTQVRRPCHFERGDAPPHTWGGRIMIRFLQFFYRPQQGFLSFREDVDGRLLSGRGVLVGSNVRRFSRSSPHTLLGKKISRRDHFHNVIQEWK